MRRLFLAAVIAFAIGTSPAAIAQPADAPAPVTPASDPGTATSTTGGAAIGTTAPTPVEALLSATPAPTPDAATRPGIAPEPGEDRNPMLPAFGGDAATAFGSQALFAQLSPLQRVWFVREYYRGRGDVASSTKWLNTMVEVRNDAGLENATSIAAALATEARQAVKDRRQPDALAAAEAATKMAPDFAGAWTTLARVQVAGGDYGSALGLSGSLRNAAGAALGNLRSRTRITGNLTLAAIGGVFLAWVLFLLVSFLRHGRFLAHDFRHALADNMPGWLAPFVLIPVLLFPLVFGLGVLPLLAWLTLVLWMKLSASERGVAAAFLLAAAGSPWLFERAALPFAFESGSAGRLYAALHEDEISKQELAAFSAVAEKDADVLLTMGIAHLRSGRYGKALEVLKQADQAGAGPSAAIGLGAVQYALGDIGKAIAAWERAAGMDGSRTAAHFNLSQIHNERTQLAAATEALKAARALDSARCDVVLARAPATARKLVTEVGTGAPIVASLYVNRLLMTDGVGDDRILARAQRDAKAIVARTWKRVSPGVPLPGITALCLAALAMGGFLTFAFKVMPSRPCPRCGRSLCLRCDGPPLEEDLCTQCYHAFIDNEGVDPRARQAKEREIEAYGAGRRRARTLLSLVAPGAGQLFYGESIAGASLLLVASIAAVRVIAWRGWFQPVFALPGSTSAILAAGLAGAVFLAAWITALRMKDPAAKGGR